MRRESIAMEELDRCFGRGANDGVVDRLLGGYGTHRLRAVGDGLRHGHHIRRTLKLCAPKALPVRPKPQITSSNTNRMPC